ncbi:hypothetical protein DFR42_104150 [Undibacterium pigrum]|uniref:Lipoprotein n=2 Tax=Undibacterium pigrum TaxID=401470 RepID=A0A318J5M6_9BURK|nr:hypothetical protein DFR42_104150 [Undibacterium pigrum]
MPYKKALLTLFILMTFTACHSGDKSVTSQSTQQDFTPALNKTNLSEIENYSMLSMQDDWKLVTWSSKPSGEPGNKNKAWIFSTVSILKKENQAWRVVSQKQFDDSYNPRLQLHTEFTIAGKPVFIARIQRGAAYEEMQVYGMQQNEYKLLQTLVAGAFEWTYDAVKNKKALLALSANPGEQAGLYQWNGQQFMLIEAADTTDTADAAKKSADYVVD